MLRINAREEGGGGGLLIFCNFVFFSCQSNILVLEEILIIPSFLMVNTKRKFGIINISSNTKILDWQDSSSKNYKGLYRTFPFCK